MTITYLKKAEKTSATDQGDVRDRVMAMLAEMEAGGDEAALKYARELDQWTGPIVVDADAFAEARASLAEHVKDDIRFAHDNVRRFAEAQLKTVSDCEIELHPGLVAGQKQIPVSAAGAYVPGGRYAHVASAIMTVTTAKVAGVPHITACSPTGAGGIPPAILFALETAGADVVLNLGGVQGIAAMAFGLFGTPEADILVGPGNQYVAEAKRLLFGRVGIDMFAGPTDLLVLADGTADPEIVAIDLVGQAVPSARTNRSVGPANMSMPT
ncbi:MAG: histidinol dehydrogenase, partial [Pseudomonadota bacterium]